jgi:competence protein ComEA
MEIDTMTNSNLLLRSSRRARPGVAVLPLRRLLVVPALALALALALAAPLAAKAQDAAAAAPATVNINKADAGTIAAALKGVGNSRATEIVRYREAYGPFTSVDELAEVKGIGQSTLDDNRALITLE